MQVNIMGINLELLIKEKRIENHISQNQLSKDSGVARGYISELEKGKYIPTVLVMGKIAKVLNCKIDDLVIM